MSMNDRKNIDRLFQEKFKDFEVTPDEAVWKKIKTQQNNKKKKVIILPLWYRAAGVAILITLLTGLNYIFFTDTSSEKNTITKSKIKNQTKESPYKPTTTKTPFVTEESITVLKEKSNSTTPDKTKTVTFPDKDVLKEKSLESKQDNSSAGKITFNNSKSSTTNPNTSPNIFSEDKTKIESTILTGKILSKEPVALYNKEKNRIVIRPLKTKSADINTIAETTNTSEINTTENKRSIFDVINKDKEVVEVSTTTKKWNIAPSIAPVYYNTLGNASSIDNQFADNDKNGQVNMSYGVQISYAINKRFSIRSGLNNVDLGYQTENVGFTPSANSPNLQSIDYNTASDIILISDNENPKGFSAFQKNPNSVQQSSGQLNQSINYLEVPLEMKYALVNNKVGINMIGGVSTLFLQKNQIHIETGDFETLIGEANNLNNLSFSGNIGLGIDYELTEQLEINLEPIFKYQFNAVNDVTNFRPYYFGVYTGINFKF